MTLIVSVSRPTMFLLAATVIALVALQMVGDHAVVRDQSSECQHVNRKADMCNFIKSKTVHEIKQCLISNQGIDTSDDYGWTPLMCAVKTGNQTFVKELIHFGANVHGKPTIYKKPTVHNTMIHPHQLNSKALMSPLGIATSIGHCGIVKVLLKAIEPDFVTDNRFTPVLMQAAKGCHACITDALTKHKDVIDVNARNSRQRVALHEAGIGCPDDKFAANTIITSLIRAGADPNIKDIHQYTPLMTQIKTRDCPETIKIISQGLVKPDLDVMTIFGDTPLRLALSKGYVKSMKQLITLGANVNDGALLSRAIVKGDHNIMKILLKAGANPELPINDPKVKDNKTQTCLEMVDTMGLTNVRVLLEQYQDRSVVGGLYESIKSFIF